MANRTGNADFWLPTEFLSDEDFVHANPNTSRTANPSPFLAEPPYAPNQTSFISPGESVIGCSETESDEEELLSLLALKFASQASIRQPSRAQKPWPLSSSPQSHLSGIPTLSGSSGCSSDLSPTDMPLDAATDALEVIYAAAGQVAKMKMEAEARTNDLSPYPFPPSFSRNPVNLSQVRNPRQSPVVLPEHPPWFPLPTGRSPAVFPKNGLQQPQIGGLPGNGRRPSDIQLRAHLQNDVSRRLQARSALLSSRSGMSAVFLNGSGVKRESVGTGVFLPRKYTNVSEPRKKAGCSPVLLPDRVVQALNLNLESLGPSVTHIPSGSILDYDTLMARRNSQIMEERRRIHRSECFSPNNEIKVQRLPQEWTY